MYSKEQLKNGLSNPYKIIEEIERLPWKWPIIANRMIEKFRSNQGVAVMEKDWDNLIVLDACRHDSFAELNQIEGKLERINSKGSMTVEWLEKNFEGKSFPDTVIISGNPNLEKVEAEFADVIKLWNEDWDEELGTARPNAVVDRTLQAYEKYPDKRIIAWFVQPHMPFLGPKGEKVPHGQFTGGGVVKDEREVVPVSRKLTLGDLDVEPVREAYEENLEIVLESVEKLINCLDGKSVVTADHGQSFGEKFLYGHPKGIHTQELVQVPWFIPDYENRRNISNATQTKKTSGTKSEVIKDKLADLGYG